MPEPIRVFRPRQLLELEPTCVAIICANAVSSSCMPTFGFNTWSAGVSYWNQLGSQSFAQRPTVVLKSMFQVMLGPLQYRSLQLEPTCRQNVVRMQSVELDSKLSVQTIGPVLEHLIKVQWPASLPPYLDKLENHSLM